MATLMMLGIAAQAQAEGYVYLTKEKTGYWAVLFSSYAASSTATSAAEVCEAIGKSMAISVSWWHGVFFVGTSPNATYYAGYEALDCVFRDSVSGVTLIQNAVFPLTRGVCPPNSTPSLPCTCDAGYKPDPTITSCVPVVTCPITGLTTDPLDPNGLKALSKKFNETDEQFNLTQKLEGGMDGYSLLSEPTKAGEKCLAKDIGNGMGYRVTSSIRTLAYQAHLRAVWDKFLKLQEATPKVRKLCPALIAEVEAEMGFRLDQNPKNKKHACASPGRAHCVRYPPASKDPKHTESTAFDVQSDTVDVYEFFLSQETPPKTVQQKADACNLIHGSTFSKPDNVHFLLKPQ